MSKHRSHFKSWMAGKKKFVTSFHVIQYEDARIELIKTFPCDSNDELRAEEQRQIDLDKDICVNTFQAYTGVPAGLNKTEYAKEYEGTPRRKAYVRKYRKQYNKKKVHCSYCGRDVTTPNKVQHEKSKLHLENVAKIA